MGPNLTNILGALGEGMLTNFNLSKISFILLLCFRGIVQVSYH